MKNKDQYKMHCYVLFSQPGPIRDECRWDLVSVTSDLVLIYAHSPGLHITFIYSHSEHCNTIMYKLYILYYFHYCMYKIINISVCNVKPKSELNLTRTSIFLNMYKHGPVVIIISQIYTRDIIIKQ